MDWDEERTERLPLWIGPWPKAILKTSAEKEEKEERENAAVAVVLMRKETGERS